MPWSQSKYTHAQNFFFSLLFTSSCSSPLSLFTALDIFLQPLVLSRPEYVISFLQFSLTQYLNFVIPLSLIFSHCLSHLNDFLLFIHCLKLLLPLHIVKIKKKMQDSSSKFFNVLSLSRQKMMWFLAA